MNTENNIIKKYSPIFNSSYRSMKMILNRDKTGMYKNVGATLKTTDEILFFPITPNRDEIFNSLHIIFGKSYKKYFKKYYFPKRYVYTKTLVKGPVKREILNKGYIQNYIKTRLPDFPSIPLNTITSKKNLIVDYSDIIKNVVSYSPEILKRPIMKLYAENIIPEIICKFLFNIDKKNTYNQYFQLTKNLDIQSSLQLSFSEIGFKKYIIPFRINSTKSKYFSYNYVSNILKLNNEIKTDPTVIYELSLLRFIARILLEDNFTEEDPNMFIKNYWLDLFKNNNIVFFFYNSKSGFVFDTKELLENMNWNRTKILKTLKDRILLLVKYNAQEINDKDFEEIILNENDESDIDKDNQISILSKKDKIVSMLKNKNIDIIGNKLSNLVSNIINTSNANKNRFFSNVTMDKNESDSIDFDNSKLDKLIQTLKDDDDEIKNGDELYDDIIDYETSEAKPEEDDDNDETLDDVLKEEKISNDDEEDHTDDDLEEELDNLALDDIDEDDKDFEDNINDFDAEIVSDILDNPDDNLDEAQQKKFFESIRKEQLPELSQKQINRIKQVRDKYKSIKISEDKTLDQIVNDIDATIIEPIKMKSNLIDKSFETFNTLDFERSYIERTYEKDILKVLLSFSSKDKDVKLHLIDYKKEDTSDQFNEKETITVKFEDENQTRHNIKFDIPKIDENFRMTINGNKKIMKKQIIFLPVVKISPTTVWLTSQYNKMYIERIDYATNRATYIVKDLLFNQLPSYPSVKIDLGDARTFNSEYLTNIEYDDLSEKILSVRLKVNNPKEMIVISFHQDKLREEIREKFPDYRFVSNRLPIAIDYKNKKVIDVNVKDSKSSISEIIISLIMESGIYVNLQKYLDEIKIPKRKSYTRIMLMSKKTPLIIFLGYLYGLANVLQVSKIPVTITAKPIRGDKRNVIKFKDAYLYYDHYPMENAFLLNGLNYMDTRDIEITAMNGEEPYLEWLYQEYETRNIAKGWMDFKELFLDAITLEILQDMKLPTDLLELLLYCNELLGDNLYEHEANGDIENIYRIRCHEVVAESVYKCISNQYKLLRKAKDPTKVSLSIPQDAVMAKLFKLTTFNNHDVTNPLNELKQRGIVTFKGSTGINDSNAFSAGKRAYGDQFPGIIALSAPDNAQVGVTKQLTANARIGSTRGYLKTYKSKKELNEAPASELISIEEAAYPLAMEKDDPKRLSYMSGQSMHTIKSSGDEPALFRSPVDKIIANVTSDVFTPKAKMKGKIIDIDEKYGKIFIQYEDGSKEYIQIGRKVVNNSSYFLDIDIESNVKVGQKVEKGDVLAYDKDFFVKEGEDLIYKQGPLTFLCVDESDSTEEDSSFITEEYTTKLRTNITQAKGIVVSPNTNMISWKKIGDHVITGDPLMVFEDAEDSTNAQILDLLDTIDEETKMETMQKSPRAEHTGEITDMKVYWTVPLEDMTPSLRKFVEDYIKKIKSEAAAETKITGKPSKKLIEIEKSIPRQNRIKKYLVPDEGGVVIEYFTTHEQGFSVGDKDSMSTALKSIIMDVVPQSEAPYTESGLVLDGCISLLSIQARHINSIWYVGFGSKILFDFSKAMAEYYFND